MSPTFLLGVFGSSLLSSLHCAGMCGPFVAFYSSGGPSTKAHWVYHSERALAYTALGTIAGALGAGVDALGQGLGAMRLAALVASALTILWGALALFPSARWLRIVPRFLPTRLVQLKTRAPVTKAIVLGISTPLLPCGTLYAFVTLAAGTGSAASGALTLFTFFVGTLPGLIGLGSVTARLGRTLGARLPRILGVALVALGLFGVYERGHSLLTAPNEEGHAACHGH